MVVGQKEKSAFKNFWKIVTSVIRWSIHRLWQYCRLTRELRTKTKQRERPATHLSRSVAKQLRNTKKQEVCRVCQAHFTEHLFRISYFTSFHSRWRFFDKISNVSCKELKFYENLETCVKECLRISHSLWNILKRCVKQEHEKCVKECLHISHSFSWNTLKRYVN